MDVTNSVTVVGATSSNVVVDVITIITAVGVTNNNMFDENNNNISMGLTYINDGSGCN